MEYKLNSAKLEDIVTSTQEVFAAASELGTINSGDLEIQASDIKADLAASDVFFAKNLTDDEDLTVSLAAGVLTLEQGDTALTADTKLHLVLKV